MSYSQNEIHALALKAARGAGLDWGVAEEAAMAVIWLEARSLDGCGALADCLDHLCANNPLHLGIQLIDGGLDIGQHEITIAPRLILPFLEIRAANSGKSIRAHLGDACFVTDGNFYKIDGDWFKLTGTIEVNFVKGLVISRQPNLKLVNRYEPAVKVIKRLVSLSHLTYAPATESSRLSGAGAGLNDND